MKKLKKFFQKAMRKFRNGNEINNELLKTYKKKILLFFHSKKFHFYLNIISKVIFHQKNKNSVLKEF